MCYDIIYPHSRVCIVTGYGLDDQGFEVRALVKSRIFTSSYRPDRFWGPTSHQMGTGDSFRGDEAAGA
jgi:hypothetical protein